MAEEEKEEKKEGEGEGAEVKPKSKKKLFIIIGVVVLLLGGGIPAFLMLGSSKTAEEAEKAAQEALLDTEPHYLTAEMDTFIVNLSESASFLKIKLLLEYDPAVLERAEGGSHAHKQGGEEGGEGGGEGHGGGNAGDGEKGKGGLPGVLGERTPMIRDAVIRVLASKHSQEVLTNEGKERLKEELIEAINDASGLDEGAVVNVYFLEFLIQ